VARIACGGWRRPHAFLIDALCMGSFAFAFLKGNHVHVHRTSPAATHSALPCPHMPPSSLHTTFHGRELHSLALLPLPPRPSPHTHTPSSPYATPTRAFSSLLLSAAEDGCLRASL
ncbi:unnamed protein product, partial [Closterium sp. NIES-53]